MKRHILIIALFLFTFYLKAQDTLIFGDTVCLSSSLSNFANVKVVGIHGVSLNSGFEYSSNGSGEFTTDGDPFGIESPSGFSPYYEGSNDSLVTSDNKLDYNCVVGSIAGKADVSPTGSAIYSIPIQVPIGNNGMEPKLSINYSSQSGMGNMGRGWNLTGISCIIATAKNYYYDGVKGPVSDDESLKRLYWDGQRLLGIDDIGIAADSFATEIKTNYKIKRYTNENGNYFKIFSPDGLTMEYGVSTKITLVYSDEWCWYLDKVYNRFGDTIFYKYAVDNADREVLLSSVEYGGKEVTPINKLTFHYADSRDIYYRNILKDRIIYDQILDSISITSNNTFIGSFSCRYNTIGTEILLNEIIQFDKDYYRYNSTKFDWNIPDFNPVTSIDTIIIESGSYFTYYSGDYNGDGFTDLVSVELDPDNNNYSYYLYLGSKQGLSNTISESESIPRSFTCVYWNEIKALLNASSCAGTYNSDFPTSIPDIAYIFSGDFDSDGIDELMIKVKEWGAFYPFLPVDLNNYNEGSYLSSKLNGFDTEVCKFDVASFILDPAGSPIQIGNGIGRLLNFDKQPGDDQRVINFRLGMDMPYWNTDSPHPDLYGKGYSMFSDNSKLMYYDPAIGSAVTMCDYMGGGIWGEFNGDGMADYIRKNGSIHELFVYNNDSVRFDKLSNIAESFLGLFDVNGDGITAWVTQGSPIIEYKTYEELWYDMCETCDINSLEWGQFLRQTGLILEYPDYCFGSCQNVDDSECRNSFLTYPLNIKEINHGRPLKINHLAGYGLNKILDTTLIDFDKAIAADIDGDNSSDLLLFDGDYLKKIYYNFNTRASIPSGIETEYSELDCSYNLSTSSQIGDFNGDGFVEIISPATNRKLSFINPGSDGYVISNITDGLGLENLYYYSRLTDTAIFIKGTDNVFPIIDIASPIQVVKSLVSDNGVADNDSTIYKYEEAKVHLQGKGFLGYKKTIKENTLTGEKLINETSIHQTYIFPYNKKSTIEQNSNILRTTENFLSINNAGDSHPKTFEIRNDSTVVNDLINNVVSTNSFIYNSSGQIEQKTIRINNVLSAKESYSYYNANWYYPYLISSISKSYISDTIIKDSTRFQYNNIGGMQSKKSYCGTQMEVETIYSDFNLSGSPRKIMKKAKKGANMTTDSTTLTIQYSDCNRFVTAKKAPLGKNTYTLYNIATGQINSIEGVNDKKISYTYGPFNSIVKQTSPELLEEVSRNYWAVNHPEAVSGALFYQWSKASGTPEIITFYDAAGRELRIVTHGFDDENIYIDTEYDNLGRISRRSLPYFQGNSILWTTYTYDALGRMVEEIAPDNTATEYEYGALWEKITVTKGSVSQSTEKTFNTKGETVSSTDNMGNIVYYNYYPDGNLKESHTSINTAHKTSFEYDKQGNRISINDPDAGTITSFYDAFGQLIRQIDARGDTTSFEYDALGRTIRSTDSRGDFYFAYINDTTIAAFGQIDSIYNTDGSLSESFTYDANYGRMLSSTKRIPDKTFTNSYTYDWYGRPWTRTYPSGFEIEYAYTDNGDLESISGDGQTIWQCNDVSALGQITSYSQGSYSTTVDYDTYGMLEEVTTGSVFNMEYGFDDMGNLEYRQDVRTSQKEEFTYDDLNRLTGIDYYLNSIHVTAGDLDLTYDNGGNITSKSDVGETMNYGEGTAGPHALTSIEEPIQAFRPPPQTITYTCFNKVNTIMDTVGQDTTLTLAFTYGLDNQRVKTVLSRNTTIERIKYFDGDYEEDSTATGTKKYHYINSPTGLIGIFVSEGSADTLYHVLTDHLGSLNGVINAETDDVTYYSFNAWGIARDPDDWTSEYTGELFAGRGFTGHEHLMEFSLINMNGRVYDPVLGRFLSPDPYVQAPGYAGSFNRYAYCLNNPLVYTDPSGELFIIDDWLIGFVKGFVRSIGGKHEDGHHTWFGDAWASANRHAGNSAKIWGGLFVTDKNLDFNQRVKQYYSRRTWELTQTVIGFLGAHGANMFTQVDDVSYYGGATVLRHNKSIGGAFTIGSYIQGGPTIQADPRTSIFQHEYGHYLQSRKYGPAYLNRYALPSLFSAAIPNSRKTWKHANYEVERDANIRARDYWNLTVPGYLPLDWNYMFNPIGSDDQLIKPSWLDYTGFPTCIFYFYSIYMHLNYFGGNV